MKHINQTDTTDIVVLVGLARSGKSCLAKKLYSLGGYKILNKDLLGEMFDCGLYTVDNEKFINGVKLGLTNEVTSAGYNAIIDDTNLNILHLSEIDEQFGTIYPIYLYIINTKKQVCIEREALTRNKIDSATFDKQEETFEKYFRRFILPENLYELDGTEFYIVELNEEVGKILWEEYINKEDKNEHS